MNTRSFHGPSQSTASTTATGPLTRGQEICLPVGKVWSWASPHRGDRLQNQSGTVWITQEGEQDIVLAPGESFVATRSGQVVVESLRGEACLQLTAA